MQASTFQMAVLLQYNASESWSIQQLHESTQIEIAFLTQVSYLFISTQFFFIIYFLTKSLPIIFLITIKWSKKKKIKTKFRSFYKHIQGCITKF